MAVAAVQITHPEPFDFSNTAEWPRWIRWFERFRLASGLSTKPEDYQVNSLLYAMEDEADDILAVLPLKNFVFLGELSSPTVQEWTETISVHGTVIQFKLDTGAAVSAVPESVFSKNKLGHLQKAKKVLYGPAPNILEVNGCFQGVLTVKGRRCIQDVYVVAGLTKALLGLPAIEALSLVHRIDAVTQQHTPNLVAAYPSVFSGLGLLQKPYHIEVEKDATQYALSTPRRVPLPLRDKVKEELDRMESMGVISKVSSPTEWCAGMVVVPKPSGNICICVDLTNLGQERTLHPTDCRRAPSDAVQCQSVHEIGC
ncbi:hypothetical protein SRHO_G00010040 [Serrasalmus rhombeus]